MRLALGLLLLCSGCRLGDLLNPGPPPPEETCYTTLRFTTVNSWGDTTVFTKSIEVPCEA